MSSGFVWSDHSKAELVGVHPTIVDFANRTLHYSTVDFGVHDGIRTAEDQYALYKRGASQRDGYRRPSQHQKQASGYGEAVDLVPRVNGRWLWDWPMIYDIADAAFRAADEIGVPITWGGCWRNITGSKMLPEWCVQDYVKRRRMQGRRAFNDGPHWELGDING